MPTVAELKERARGLEQSGDLAAALKIYRHVLAHLEGTSAITAEVPLYVKAGDLAHKLDDAAAAIAHYERAADYYAEAGSARSLGALALKIRRVDPSLDNVYGRFARDLLQHGHGEPAIELLNEAVERLDLSQLRMAMAVVAAKSEAEGASDVERLTAALAESAPAVEEAAEALLHPPYAATPKELPISAGPSAVEPEQPQPEPEPEPEAAPELEAAPAPDLVYGPILDEGEESAADMWEREMEAAAAAQTRGEPEPPPAPPAEKPIEEAAGAAPPAAPEASALEGHLVELDAGSSAADAPAEPGWEPAPEPPRPPAASPPEAERPPEHEEALQSALDTAASRPPDADRPSSDDLEWLEQWKSEPEAEPAEAQPAPPVEEPARVAPAAEWESAAEPAAATPEIGRHPGERVLFGSPTRRRGGRNRVLAVAAGAVVVVAGGAALVLALRQRGSDGADRPRPDTALVSTVPGPRPAAPVATGQDSGPILTPPSRDSALPAVALDTSARSPTGPPAVRGAVADTPAAPLPPVTQPSLVIPPVATDTVRPRAPPVDTTPPRPREPTVQVPIGTRLDQLLIVVDGLPVDSVAVRDVGGRPAHRIVQRLASGEPLVLSSSPMGGADTAGITDVRVTVAGDTTVGSVRYWSYLVTARGRVGADTLARLLRRLVRARPVP